MRIIVCGGRDFAKVVRTKGLIKDESEEMQEAIRQYRFVFAELDKIIMEFSKERNDHDNWLPTDIVIIEGGADGVDSAAVDFATNNYCQLEEYKADWDVFGLAAGPIRNKRMIEEGKPDLVVAFPGGKGTANMVKQAVYAGIPVRLIKYEKANSETS